MFSLGVLVSVAAACGLLSGSAWGAGVSEISPEILSRMTSQYNATVKPILDSKCLDCHGNNPKYPFYYGLPGAKQLIDRDVEYARARFNFSNGFSFQERAALVGDLKALRKEVTSETMPLFRYVMLHPEAKITAAEKKALLKWIEESLALLGEK